MKKTKEYYCLLLNNCSDVSIHYLTLNEHSIIKNVLKKEYQELNKDLLFRDFLELDDKITYEKNSYLVEGSFPVIAECINGEMIDIITKKIIIYSEDGNTKELSYKSKSKAFEPIVKAMLQILDKQSLIRYIQGINKIAKNSQEKIKETEYYLLTVDNFKVCAMLVDKDNMKMIDLITRKVIYPKLPATVIHNLTYDNKEPYTEDEVIQFLSNLDEEAGNNYIAIIKEIETSSICKYNNYINLEKAKKRELTK